MFFVLIVVGLSLFEAALHLKRQCVIVFLLLYRLLDALHVF